MKRIFKTFLFITILAASPLCRATVTLPSFFTDNMVLQQKSAVPFFGTSTGKQVTVTTSWDKKSYTAKTVNGKWEVSLATPVYGGPYTITADDGKKTELKNILIGEVWLCSGQSNMEMPLEGWGKINNYAEEIKNANYPEIRLLQAAHRTATEPADNIILQHKWQVCSPESVADFSSAAYFFARKIYQEKHIPIGLIHSSWGGTLIEAWTSAGALTTIHDFDEGIASLKNKEDEEALQKKYDADFKEWNLKLNKADAGMKDGKALWAATTFDDASWQQMALPGFYEYSGLADFDGVVWFRKNIDITEVGGSDYVLEYYADDDDMLWVNGSFIGATQGYNVLRHYTIPANRLKKGNNVITIRTYDGSGGGGIYGPEKISLKSASKAYLLSGVWKYSVGVNITKVPGRPQLPMGQDRPSVLYNAMIYPLLKYKIAGVIWYQGESNAERAKQYQTLFPLMIYDWRKQFNNKELPFYYVQLANFMQVKNEPAESNWAELREAQYKTLSVPLTGMAVITDIGDAKDIHPKDKQDVGLRLALIALAKTYGMKIDYSGPLYKSYKATDNTIILDFVHGEGIKAKDGQLKGFAIAGEDKKFYWAEAKVIGERIEVSSAKVPKPVAVRYNWADNPEGNLTNSSGLPASSFRTDTWPGLTEGKK